jgi:hypothetical protein
MTLVNLMPKPEVDEITLMYRLNITFTEASILKQMWLNGNKGIRQYPPVRATRQHIYNMRPKLAKHNIAIVNMSAGHYGIPIQSRLLLERMFSF